MATDELPGYFGYLGPELEELITTEVNEPQYVIMGRRTSGALAGLPDEACDESWHRMAVLNKIIFCRTLAEGGLAEHADLWSGSRQ